MTVARPRSARFLTMTAVLALLPAVAAAQETIIIGGSSRPPVEVNLGVLNEPAGGLTIGGQDGPIRLRPPGSAAPRAAAPRSNTASAPRPATTTTARATPAAPPPLSANDRRALSPAQAAPPPAPRLERPTAPAAVTTQPLPAPTAPALPPINLPQVATPQPAPAPAQTAGRPVAQPIPPVIPPPSTPAPQIAAAPAQAQAQAPAAAPVPAPAQVPALAAAPRAQTPVAPPAPAPAPRAAPTPAPVQTAALSTVRLADGSTQAARLGFQTGSSTITADSERELRRLAQVLAGNENRVQLRAYADGPDDRPSTARRLSLSRALAVRSSLIEAGLRSTRIDVRALGSPGDGGPIDRVDVILLTQ